MALQGSRENKKEVQQIQKIHEKMRPQHIQSDPWKMRVQISKVIHEKMRWQCMQNSFKRESCHVASAISITNPHSSTSQDVTA
jgi:hypothetical protein